MAITNCKVTYGINNVCGDLLQASGVQKDVYFGYISDLSIRFALTQTAAISSISWLAYAGLVKFSGQKFSNEAGYALVKAGGGAISYAPKVTVRAMNLSTQDDVELQKLTQAQDVFAIVGDNNESFYIFGASNGLTADAGELKAFGKGAGEDTIATVVLSGNEKTLPLRFLVSDYATTVAYLENSIR